MSTMCLDPISLWPTKDSGVESSTFESRTLRCLEPRSVESSLSAGEDELNNARDEDLKNEFVGTGDVLPKCPWPGINDAPLIDALHTGADKNSEMYRIRRRTEAPNIDLKGGQRLFNSRFDLCVIFFAGCWVIAVINTTAGSEDRIRC